MIILGIYLFFEGLKTDEWYLVLLLEVFPIVGMVICVSMFIYKE